MARTIHAEVQRHGFEEWQTGGGCMAYRRPGPEGEGSEALITDVNGAHLPATHKTPVFLGFYGPDGEILAEFENCTLATALMISDIRAARGTFRTAELAQ
jgi:hypothetical protein